MPEPPPVPHPHSRWLSPVRCAPEVGHICAELLCFRRLVGVSFSRRRRPDHEQQMHSSLFLFWSLPELMLIVSQPQEHISGLEALPSEALLSGAPSWRPKGGYWKVGEHGYCHQGALGVRQETALSSVSCQPVGGDNQMHIKDTGSGQRQKRKNPGTSLFQSVQWSPTTLPVKSDCGVPSTACPPLHPSSLMTTLPAGSSSARKQRALSSSSGVQLAAAPSLLFPWPGAAYASPSSSLTSSPCLFRPLPCCFLTMSVEPALPFSPHPHLPSFPALLFFTALFTISMYIMYLSTTV